MRRVFINIFICFIMMLITFIAIWFIPGNYSHDLAALINKREMLGSKESPRMIFMGGSSQLTLNSPLIEEELKFSVVNMSLWGGLSTQRYLEEIKPCIKPGDIVVLTQEYAATIEPKFIHYINTNEEAKRYLFLMSPGKHISMYIKRREYFSMFKIIFKLCQTKARSYMRNLLTFNFSLLFKSGLPDYHKKFNNNGDRINQFKIIRPLGDSGKVYSGADMKNHIFLNDFYNYAKEKKARVFFYFSHFPEEEYRLNEKHINSFHKGLKKLLKFPIINTPMDFMFPRDYFADTIYHLNSKGEKVRTEKMIEFLKKVL